MFDSTMSRLAVLAFVLMSPAPGQAAPQGEPQVPLWTRFETQLEATTPAAHHLIEPDVEVTVDLTSPGGRVHQVRAFWDGGAAFKFRFAPGEPGRWSWRTRATKTNDAGVHDRSGAFVAVPYRGKNPLYRHGALRLSPDRHYLVHADGTPFFWLADTAWNGPMKADPASWDRYLRNRATKRFNVIQYVSTQWRAATGNGDARPAFVGREKIEFDPAFFRWMDQRVDAINEHGLVGAPVAIWAIGGPYSELNPSTLPDDQVIRLARYLVARYGAHQLVWFLAGDGDYRGPAAERWRKIGRAVFGERPDLLATMHPGGQKWVAEEFRKEPWFAFNGYQSGHYATGKVLNFLLDSGLVKEASATPALPQINLEPSYELHTIGGAPPLFTGLDVRRASWWSVLLAPPAGITYGAQGVWSWELARNHAMLHGKAGVARPWHEVLDVEGAVSMRHLHAFFSSVKWWTLRPAPDLLVDAPARTTPDRFIVAARSAVDRLAVVYVPTGGEAKLREGVLTVKTAEWLDPSTGARRRTTGRSENGAVVFRAPNPQRDWVLVVRTQGE